MVAVVPTFSAPVLVSTAPCTVPDAVMFPATPTGPDKVVAPATFRVLFETSAPPVTVPEALTPPVTFAPARKVAGPARVAGPATERGPKLDRLAAVAVPDTERLPVTAPPPLIVISPVTISAPPIVASPETARVADCTAPDAVKLPVTLVAPVMLTPPFIVVAPVIVAVVATVRAPVEASVPPWTVPEEVTEADVNAPVTVAVVLTFSAPVLVRVCPCTVPPLVMFPEHEKLFALNAPFTASDGALRGPEEEMEDAEIGPVAVTPPVTAKGTAQLAELAVNLNRSVNVPVGPELSVLASDNASPAPLSVFEVNMRILPSPYVPTPYLSPTLLPWAEIMSPGTGVVHAMAGPTPPASTVPENSPWPITSSVCVGGMPSPILNELWL